MAMTTDREGQGDLWFGLAAAIVYSLAYHGLPMEHLPFNYLADAFLHGRVAIPDPLPPGLIEAIPIGGAHTFGYGVMPALVMLPLVFLFGTQVDTAAVVIAVASVNVGLMHRSLRLAGHGKNSAGWLTVLFAFGTVHFGAAAWGTAWFFMHILGVFFLLLAINEWLGRGRGFLMGLFLGAAMLNRSVLLLAAPALLYPIVRARRWRDLVAFGAGLAPGLALYMSYNWLRFGDALDNGYRHVFGADTRPMFSLRYFRDNAAAYLLRVPERIGPPLWIRPSLDGMSVLMTTPAFLYLARAWRRDDVTIGSWLAAAAIGTLYLLYFWQGYAQFGMRYTLDFTPFLILLVGVGCRGTMSTALRVLIVLSVLVNAWGVAWWRWGGLIEP